MSLFSEYDKQNKGYFTWKQLHVTLGKKGHSDSDIKELWQVYDANQNKKVTFVEFWEAIAEYN